MEYEFGQMAGPQTSIHAQRIKHTDDSEKSLLWLSTQAPQAAELLSHAKVQAICHGCTASGFLKTPQEDLDQAKELTAQTQIPCVTSAASIVGALRAVSAQKISVASPYEPWLNERVKIYLELAGFEVLAIAGLGTQAHGSISAPVIKALAHEVMRTNTEALFISCSNFRTLSLITELENELGRPVITSNQASMWGALRSMNDLRTIKHAGKLFQTQ
ncbi:MAG: maleate cis-trans isomerase [Betaproteobacteria bacterium]|jgi:maleate isomerase|nr:maleate cis-trans isomerase [Betaproteobacteria bacterium]